MHHRRPPASPAARAVAPARPETPDFTPVPTAPRHDGWTPERQVAFIEALAQSACVAEAAASVGKSRASAYALRRRADAAAFRAAWDFALDYAVHLLGEAVLARALHGVARPVFYQGEQIGERRYYDERLAMFVLRYRQPERYGAVLDHLRGDRAPDALAQGLAQACAAIAADDQPGEAPAAPMHTGRPADPLPSPLPRYRTVKQAEQQDRFCDVATEEQTTREILKRLDAIARHNAARADDAPASEDDDDGHDDGYDDGYDGDDDRDFDDDDADEARDPDDAADQPSPAGARPGPVMGPEVGPKTGPENGDVVSTSSTSAPVTLSRHGNEMMIKRYHGAGTGRST